VEEGKPLFPEGIWIDVHRPPGDPFPPNNRQKNDQELRQLQEDVGMIKKTIAGHERVEPSPGGPLLT